MFYARSILPIKSTKPQSQWVRKSHSIYLAALYEVANIQIRVNFPEVNSWRRRSFIVCVHHI